jgi:hypothetical protein
MGIGEKHDILQNIRVYCASLPLSTSIEARTQYRCLPGSESESRSDLQFGDNFDHVAAEQLRGDVAFVVPMP